MVKRRTCFEVFNDHCRHWGLSEPAHALVHATIRRINEVADIDRANGIELGMGESTTSVSDDGPRLLALLRDEGYDVVPRQ
ncbi:MAG TPA: hypothetical protein VGQ02_10765 [Candidatus Limnocylindrales bacterium]|jgi:hypothetical protein|nr:hypothetical protein [Candidatus Limnocylindrales bacterium]